MPDINPIYAREKYDTDIESKESMKDKRDKGCIIFDLFMDNVQEAFSTDKISRKINNTYLEFLGEGVISLFLAWDMIINHPNSKDADIDSKRIENSSTKKFLEVMSNKENKLYEYSGIPVHKTLEFFVPPFLKSSYYLKAKFFK